MTAQNPPATYHFCIQRLFNEALIDRALACLILHTPYRYQLDSWILQHATHIRAMMSIIEAQTPLRNPLIMEKIRLVTTGVVATYLVDLVASAMVLEVANLTFGC